MTHARAPRLGIGVNRLELATAGTAAVGLEHGAKQNTRDNLQNRKRARRSIGSWRIGRDYASFAVLRRCSWHACAASTAAVLPQRVGREHVGGQAIGQQPLIRHRLPVGDAPGAGPGLLVVRDTENIPLSLNTDS